MNEPEILKRAQAFDLEALEMIYDHFRLPLLRYAMRLLGDEDKAEECVAETFTRLLKALREGKGPTDALQAYLYRVAHNWITDTYRQKHKQTISLDELDDNNDNGENNRHLQDAQDVPHEAELRERQQLLRAALAKLKPEQREVVTLKFIEGWDNEQVATAVGKPITAIKSLQQRALAGLRNSLSMLKNEVQA